DLSGNVRFGKGGFVSGGASMGRTVVNNCFQNNLPQVVARDFSVAISGNDQYLATGPRADGYCNYSPPWSANMQFKASGIYPLPWWGLQTSFTFQNVSGIPIDDAQRRGSANWAATNADVLPSLGRNLSAGATATAEAANGGIPLIKPGTMFEDRLN